MEYTVDGNSKQRLQLILDDFSQKFPYKPKRSIPYLKTINEGLLQLKEIPSLFLGSIASHQFYQTLRNLTTDLLIKWNFSYTLNRDETFLLRNCILLLHRLVHHVKHITVLSLWLLDPSFIKATADCMKNIDQLVSKDHEKHRFKQLARLLDLFSTYYQRLPSNLQKDQRFNRLFEATMSCLTSSTYDQTFRQLNLHAKSMQTKERFFLILCPSFLSSKHAAQSNFIIEQLLETMVPRYASILDKHIKLINQWNSAIIHAVHQLLLTVVFGKRHYTPYSHGQPLQWLIDHVVCIISQSSIVSKTNEDEATCETLLIDSALKTLTAFVRDPDLLIYIKQLKIQSIFRSFILSPCESIVYHTYIILSYIMDEEDIKASEKDSGRLLSNIFDSLRKKIRLHSESNENEELTEYNIALLVEAIQVLVQHDQIKSEILKQNALPLLINNIEHINNKSQRLILESLGSMTFDAEAARLLRENTQFISSVKDIQYTMDDGVRKAAEKIIWNLMTEPKKVAERKEKIQKEDSKSDDEDEKEEKLKNDEYEYDIMISYCHADKELVHKIHRFLADQGFKIWIDRDQIYGPAMQAMAEAVENSEFVILCMSDSYKRSVYCQAEAEYAFQCKRRLIPLIVRQAYRPDGWLGLLLGSRIYIDFGRFDFKKGCESILNEITLQRKSQLNIDKENGHTTSSEAEVDPTKVMASNESSKMHLSKEYIDRDTSKATYHSIPIHRWTNKNVLDFLFDSNLYLMMPLCESLNGHGLEKFFRMGQKNPTKFYSQLNDELRSRFDDLLPIGIFTQFLTEIEQILQPTHDIQPIASQSKSVSRSPTNIVKSDSTISVPKSLPSPQNIVKSDSTISVPKSSPKNIVKSDSTTLVPKSLPSPQNIVKSDSTISVPKPSSKNIVKSDSTISVPKPSSKNIIKSDSTILVPKSLPSPQNIVKSDSTISMPKPSSKNIVKSDSTLSVPKSLPSPQNIVKSDSTISVPKPLPSPKNIVKSDSTISVPKPSSKNIVKSDSTISMPKPSPSPKNIVKSDSTTSLRTTSSSSTDTVKSDSVTSVSILSPPLPILW